MKANTIMRLVCLASQKKLPNTYYIAKDIIRNVSAV